MAQNSRIELTGKKFGLLSVLHDGKDPRYVAPPRGSSRNRYVLCQCDCGARTSVRVDHLRRGKTRSCGCLPQGDPFAKAMEALVAGDSEQFDAMSAKCEILAQGAAAHRAMDSAHVEALREDDERRPRQTEAEKRFDLPPGEYAAMLARQGGVCGICEDRPVYRALAVDHCHATGKIRGLLCQKCNNALGLFKDDIMLLAKAMRYLSPPPQ